MNGFNADYVIGAVITDIGFSSDKSCRRWRDFMVIFYDVRRRIFNTICSLVSARVLSTITLQFTRGQQQCGKCSAQ